MADTQNVNAPVLPNSSPAVVAERLLAREERITFFVGPNKIKVDVLKRRLVHVSEFFNNAHADQPFDFEDVEVLVFEIFLTWIHTHRLGGYREGPIRDWMEATQTRSGQDPIGPTDLLAVKAYCFAHRFLVKDMLTVMTYRITHDHSTFSCQALAYAFKHLPRDSPFLNYLVGRYCVSASNIPLNIRQHGRSLPLDFYARALEFTTRMMHTNGFRHQKFVYKWNWPYEREAARALQALADDPNNRISFEDMRCQRCLRNEEKAREIEEEQMREEAGRAA